MEPVEVLKACRDSRQRMRQLNDEVTMMRDGLLTLGPTKPLRDRLSCKERELKRLREGHVQLIGDAMQAVELAPAYGHKVLYAFYVLGYTNEQVSSYTGLSNRSVYRRKRDALRALGGEDAEG